MKRLMILALIIMGMASCTTVASGHRGVEISWGGETNMEMIYPEGMNSGIHWVWDGMEEYDCREQTMTISETFLDFDGLDTPVEVILYYRADPTSVNKLHKEIGHEYRQRLKGVFKSAVRTVIAKHQALKLNREDRDIAEQSMEDILEDKLANMYVIFKNIEITDIALPAKISNMIVQAKEQDEKNNLAAKLKIEAEEKAAAQEARAKGEYQAAIYDAKTKDILSQPKMLALLKVENERLMWEGFLEHGKSPYGSNNVFGGGVGVLKGLK